MFIIMLQSEQGDKRCSSTFVVLALSNNDPAH
jgi:hypothetical protein